MLPVRSPSFPTRGSSDLLDSGRILFARGADQRFTPASMAKVMTAYVVIDLIEKGELSRDKLFTVEDATWKLWSARRGESTMFLRAGEKVSVDDLLKGRITVSDRKSVV